MRGTRIARVCNFFFVVFLLLKNCFETRIYCAELAISPNNNEVHVYHLDKASGNYEKKYVLREVCLSVHCSHVLQHTQTVTSIDWAPVSNRIVSAGQDRNAYVWSFDVGAFGLV